MQNFHTIEYSTDLQEIGKSYPQIQKMRKGYDFKPENSIDKLSRCDKKFPNFSPDLNHFILPSSSIATDFISNSISSKGMIVSEKVVELFKKITHCPVQFYPAEIMHKSSILKKYFWMHIVSDYTDKINYFKTNFVILQDYKHEHGAIQINSLADLVEKKQELINNNPDLTMTIWAESITLSSQFNSTLDFFEIGTFDNNIYVSDLFFKLYHDTNLTGLLIKQSNKLNIE
ncbi:hypothetical protein FAZ19_02435 [Sphingobacterium alkalisoli]|uniref:Uncharacterized protein n=1 Tax=Sphingobacterium alkalisoli TaxID=1874115 RepID=A0A4U0H8E6_9SPHI|nr:hypothetical protein [Sphingobacterium alkalisoli]TJY68137.1 hypothetical protein FAZ19_02435 [Sphingobacterium alkalisoli]GGH08797.1 hypothetical protein GCM10011418_06440 [Sphingobacterium alkalisoli]